MPVVAAVSVIVAGIDTPGPNTIGSTGENGGSIASWLKVNSKTGNIQPALTSSVIVTVKGVPTVIRVV